MNEWDKYQVDVNHANDRMVNIIQNNNKNKVGWAFNNRDFAEGSRRFDENMTDKRDRTTIASNTQKASERRDELAWEKWRSGQLKRDLVDSRYGYQLDNMGRENAIKDKQAEVLSGSVDGTLERQPYVNETALNRAKYNNNNSSFNLEQQPLINNTKAIRNIDNNSMTMNNHDNLSMNLDTKNKSLANRNYKESVNYYSTNIPDSTRYAIGEDFGGNITPAFEAALSGDLDKANSYANSQGIETRFFKDEDGTVKFEANGHVFPVDKAFAASVDNSYNTKARQIDRVTTKKGKEISKIFSNPNGNIDVTLKKLSGKLDGFNKFATIPRGDIEKMVEWGEKAKGFGKTAALAKIIQSIEAEEGNGVLPGAIESAQRFVDANIDKLDPKWTERYNKARAKVHKLDPALGWNKSDLKVFKNHKGQNVDFATKTKDIEYQIQQSLPANAVQVTDSDKPSATEIPKSLNQALADKKAHPNYEIFYDKHNRRFITQPVDGESIVGAASRWLSDSSQYGMWDAKGARTDENLIPAFGDDLDLNQEILELMKGY